MRDISIDIPWPNKAAEGVLARILDVYYAPNIDLTTRQQQVENGSLDHCARFHRGVPDRAFEMTAPSIDLPPTR